MRIIETVPQARHNDPHTSVEAAASVIGVAGNQCEWILDALRKFGACTAADLANHLFPLDSVAVTRRLSDLHRAGKVQRKQIGTQGGRPVYQTRPMPSGRYGCVWHLKP